MERDARLSKHTVVWHAHITHKHVSCKTPFYFFCNVVQAMERDARLSKHTVVWRVVGDMLR